MFNGKHGNVFQELQFIHGPTAYQNLEKVKKIRNTLKRFISSNGCYRKVITRVIKDAVVFHEKWRCTSVTGFGTYRSKCSVHSVIIIAAHLCQKYNLKDIPETISEIISTSFRCEGGFDRFLCFLDPLIFPFEVDPILYPAARHLGTKNAVDKQLDILEYFLKASESVRVSVDFSEFDIEVDGAPCSTTSQQVSMVEVPVTMCRGSTPLLLACHAINSRAVLLLLRHGADPLRPGQVQYIVGMQFQLPIYVIVTKLNASVFWNTHNRHLDPDSRDQFLERQRANDEELKKCIQYFCRSSTRIPIVTSNSVTAQQSFMGMEVRARSIFQIHPQYQDLIPDERWRSPAELTHICRCAIRTILLQQLALPSGIDKLPLPQLIKEYLDLAYD